MNFPWWLFVLYLAKGADFASTEIVLARPSFYEVGGREGNLLLQHQAVRVGAFIAAPALVEWGAQTLERKGKPRGALWFRIVVIVGWSLAAAANASGGL